MTKNYLLHIGLWCFMILFVFDYHWFEVTWYKALGFSLLEILGYMFIFYANSWNLNRYANSKRVYLILFSTLVVVAYITAIRMSGLEPYFYEAGEYRNLFSLFLNSFLFTGLAYLFFSVENYFQTREKNLLLESKNNQLQIESLKNRINPHFIFNTLNNMNALIVKKDDRLPTYLSKLSKVLRYSIDDGSQKTLPLKKELEYLNDYLELFRMQEPASNNIDFYVEGNTEGLRIIPFVLMTLLENAIKHGDIMQNPEGYLHLNIIIDDNFLLELYNSVSTPSKNDLGTGLQNIEQQLTLMYGKSYQLTSKSSEKNYKTTLSIDLSNLK